MFESAAVAYGPQVIGVVLSGTLWDGARGLRAIKQAEGVTIVQDPDEAEYPSMPINALQATQVLSVFSLPPETPPLRLTQAQLQSFQRTLRALGKHRVL
jgi:chemotaxis response regulator CheB